MNNYCRNQRQQARVNREHFILYHWCFFAECRKWTTEDWHTRLKAEGLLAQSTYHLDCPSINRLIRQLHNA